MIVFTSILISPCIYKRAKPTNHSCNLVERSQVFILFRWEKLPSDVATLTGNEINNCRHLSFAGKMFSSHDKFSGIPLSIISCVRDLQRSNSAFNLVPIKFLFSLLFSPCKYSEVVSNNITSASGFELNSIISFWMRLLMYEACAFELSSFFNKLSPLSSLNRVRSLKFPSLLRTSS
ncbi:unnamed protein product [Acanthoscelides obtectus]|uniref:Uncharacterized protein n=1 Tax=Acanthoscelides obtectus TaxID=200917 RepID=A0A9P0LLE5_ACAOB|nr:unnamed protein product [Acanthoscelides obtectus]CAK1635198.1 hypothetical protein AOBTE_LOCUS9130 [Acanthoscelides obtectus]